MGPSLLFIEDVWHDVQKGSGYILGSISCQKFEVPPAINDLVYLCPNIWCNNSKASLFLGDTFFDLAFSFVFTKDVYFLYGLCSRVTAFYFLSPKSGLGKSKIFFKSKSKS